jgi:glutaredoxin/glutathione-dependent peroxiredoxin
MVKINDVLPSATFKVMTADGKQDMNTENIFNGRKVVLFGVPGAFTGTCTNAHMPSFLANFDAIKAKGVDMIACTSVNDIDVMNAWAKFTGAEGKIVMLADGNATFAKTLGLEKDLTVAGMGLRSSRYSMIVDNGVVKQLNTEANPGKMEVSGAETIMGQL